MPDSAPALKHVDPSAARAAFPDVPPVTAPAQAAAAPPASELDRARLESRRVAEARSQLRAGNARGALSLLQAIAVEFPSGVLVQEREALTIESLLSCGEQAAARTRALDFLRRYPGSPHTHSVQRALR
jgi:outer membrane protein assembly factor BamD (BamD/ComL family)